MACPLLAICGADPWWEGKMRVKVGGKSDRLLSCFLLNKKPNLKKG